MQKALGSSPSTKKKEGRKGEEGRRGKGRGREERKEYP
jgi:hypothetical protein